MKKCEKVIDVAMGRKDADIVLTGASVLNVFTHQFEEIDISICDGYIAAVGSRGSYKGIQEIDYTGKFIVPGFIDAHMHIESSMLIPSELLKILLPCGTTTIIADSHEIANVLGVDGVRFMSQNAQTSPGHAYFMIPSCVPSTDFENTGAELTAKDIQELFSLPNALGLGEMMNYPGIINADKDVLKKIEVSQGRICDGHAPLLSGKSLQAYCSTGIKTDHESRSFFEAKEKIGCGMWTLLREGSSARDLEHILPDAVKEGFYFNRFAYCTDDKNAMDIMRQGHIDHAIKKAIELKVPIIDAYCMATINPAECFGLSEHGAICAGRFADLVVIDNLEKVSIIDVFTQGQRVADLKKTQKITYATVENKALLHRAEHSVVLGDIHEEMFSFGKNDSELSSIDRHVIKLVPGILNTENSLYPKNTITKAFDEGKLCKVCVVERHKNTGNFGLGLLEGYGLTNGSIATTVGHDSHNIICIGKDAHDMKVAVEHLKTMQGGYCIVQNGIVTASLQLSVAGLMSSENAKTLIKKLEKLDLEVKNLGIYEDIEPFITMAFLALPVIPALRITDKGLFDVLQWRFEKY